MNGWQFHLLTMEAEDTMDEQTWDGFVLGIGRKYFWARLVDQFEARLPIARVTKRDRNVFQVGALFNLHIRGSRYSLRFSHRRWTKAELAEANKRAQKLIKGFTDSA
jgi:hypothetical protein